MAQTIFIPREADNEPRVAGSPETVKRLAGLGFTVIVEAGAGHASHLSDEAYRAAGAVIGQVSDAGKAHIILKVRRPDDDEIKAYRRGAVVIAIMDPYGHEQAINAMARAGLTTFAMELMPRITRAQSMDVLSSQANLAGYRAVIDAAVAYNRALPMMMTAAGTVPAAKVFVMGAGVAGLQAIATARRLGAVVTATDVRPAAKEQVASLGAKFIAVEDEEFRQAEAAGGYAKEMSKEYQAKQAALIAEHIAKQDIVITTALIPGRPAPRLITKEMVASMRSGSVVVDLAVERGGNVEGVKADKVVITDNGVTILGPLNMAGRIAASASLLYAKNLSAFLETMVDKNEKRLAINFEDELVKATLLTHEGRIVHPAFTSQSQETTKAASSAEEAASETSDGKGRNAGKAAARKTAKRTVTRSSGARSATRKSEGDS